jgi:glycosyltransferase involved in cell wall biosynthesis
MKIAVWHNLPSGGGKRALYYHVRGLLERGHIVESWCPPTADQTYLPLSELITEHIVPFSWESRSLKQPIFKSIAAYYDVVEKIEAMDRHCQECAEEINRGGFDLLFANACMFFRLTSIGRYVKIPKLIYLGEPYRALYEAQPQLPWLALPPPKKLWWSPRYLRQFLTNLLILQGLRIQAREELLNAKAFDTILVNSFFSRESVLRAYGLDAKVCYLGIDTELFHNQHQQRQDFIVGLGYFSAEKNIGLVIESVAKVKEPRPSLVWVGNAGSPEYIEEMKQFAKSLNVDFNPKLRIDDTELVGILNRAMMMIYAPRLEPFGFAPLEANACGLPVIAVAEGGVRETIIDGLNGLIVENDVKELARAIDSLRRDKDYAHKLGENGRKLVTEKWSLKPSIDRLERRFKEVIDQFTND